MARLLSLGQDPHWRRFMVSRVPTNADSVLDVATGTGAVALGLVRERGARRVIGLDQSTQMLRRGAERVRDAGLTGKVAFVLGSAECLPFPDGSFDALTFTYLLRYVDDVPSTLRELARVVRLGGAMANLEFHVPPNPAWEAAWWCYTRLVLPAAGRLSSRAWADTGRFLGPSISGFYRRHPLDEQLGIWRAAGIQDVRARPMSLGGGVLIWGTKHG